MKIVWESNSQAKRLAGQGKIKYEDIIPRTQTDNFPAEAATVRMRRLSDKTPSVTVHIRGKSVKRRYKYAMASTVSDTYECADTCRVNIADDWKTGTMSSNGELAAQYSWKDVHNVVEEVKKVMDI